MDITFKHTELFGGAIVVDLPEGFKNVSIIRQVPDNQEVYLDANGFTSIIFDITERVSHLATDEDALKYHFEDIVETGEGVRMCDSTTATFAKLPTTTPALHLLATTTAPPRPSSSSTAPTPTFTLISLLLLRLPAQETDIAITINIPCMPSSYDEGDVDFEKGKVSGPSAETGDTVKQRVLQSLEIRDWGLFGGGGNEGEE